MKFSANMEFRSKFSEAKDKTEEAARLGIRDTVVEVQRDSVIGSPWLTGHNRRSMAGEVSGMGVVVQGEDAQPERVVDDNKIEGAVYSTSGYGGYLETGTVRLGARPYMKPALDKNFTAEKVAGRTKTHLEGR